MKETLHKRVEALAKKARANGQLKDVRTVHASSLHQIIKTKEQAARFMKLLKEA